MSYMSANVKIQGHLTNSLQLKLAPLCSDGQRDEMLFPSHQRENQNKETKA